MARSREKWGFWLWIFAGEREMTGVYWSVIGHRLRVGVEGGKGKAQEWCRLMWMRVEMWEMGRTWCSLSPTESMPPQSSLRKEFPGW